MNRVLQSIATVLLALWAAAAPAAEGASTRETALVAPKWLEHPALDGLVGAREYEPGQPATIVSGSGTACATVTALHSSEDLYVGLRETGACPPARSLTLAADVATASPAATRLYISITADGAVVTEQAQVGARVPVELAKQALDVAVHRDRDRLLHAEIRIDLDNLSGYGRRTAFGLWLEGENRVVLAQWPRHGEISMPGTWGSLDLEPRFSPRTTAGSLFLDGETGHAAIPFTPDLSPEAITVATWVRMPERTEGTILDAPAAGFRLAVDGVIEWQRGAAEIRRGNTRLGTGWHHVAVSEDAAGNSTIYLDGQLDARHAGRSLRARRQQSGGTREQETDPPVRRPRSTLPAPITVGVSLDEAAGASKALHGYVSGVQIWHVVRSANEILAAALAASPVSEPGLIASWPFANGIEDRRGGHDAGLVGGAYLSTQRPDVRNFAPRAVRGSGPVLSSRDPRVARAPWKKVLAWLPVAPTVDGVIRPGEYGDLSALPMSSLTSGIRMGLTPEGLALAVDFMLGGSRPEDALVLYIDSTARGGRDPHKDTLRLTLRANGTLEVAAGGRRGYQPVSAEGILARTGGDASYTVQDEDGILQAPWWSTELFIPYRALTPFGPGKALRVALSVPGTSVPREAAALINHAAAPSRWPTAFNPDAPNTWELVQTIDPSRAAQAARTSGSPATSREPLSGTAQCKIPNPPTSADHQGRCSTGLANVWDATSKWPDVVTDIDWPPGTHIDCSSFARVEGTLHDITISHEDATPIHDSHDFDMHLDVAPGNEWAVIDGKASIVLESESGKLDIRALPRINDHVTVYGQWIFDCGHAPKTEIHPIPVLETDRYEHRVIWPGGDLVKVSVVRVWITRNPGTQSFPGLLEGTYEFVVNAPGSTVGGAVPFVRLVTGPKGTLERASFTLQGTQVGIKLEKPDEGYHEFVIGRLSPGGALGLTTYAVQPSPIFINDDRDSGTKGDGEWFMLMNINGNWRKIFWNKEVSDDEDDGYLLPWGPTETVDNELRVQVIGYEDDDDFKNIGGLGDEITENTEGYWTVGTLSQLATQLPKTLTKGDWSVRFSVGSNGAEMPALFTSSGTWKPRVLEEVSGDFDLGHIVVPGPGEPAAKVTHQAYLLRNLATRPDATRLLAPDTEDHYKFSFSDFADLTVQVNGAAQKELTWTHPWFASAPESLKQVLGYQAAGLRVFSKSSVAADDLYEVQISAKYRILPPDPGEPFDPPGGIVPIGSASRLIDLRTPDPKAMVLGNTRSFTTYWAWQHVQEDVDTFTVLIPIPKPVSGDLVVFSCKYNTQERLEIDAPGMELTPAKLEPQIVALGSILPSSVTLDHLYQKFPDGKIRVDVFKSKPPRGVYQLTVVWHDRQLYDPDECAAIDALFKLIGYSTKTVPVDWIMPKPEPDPIAWSLRLELSALGAIVPLRSVDSSGLSILLGTQGSTSARLRLFDRFGVLVAESSSRNGFAGLDKALAADLRPAELLVADRLQVGQDYLLQIVPSRAASSGTRVGLAIKRSSRAAE